eukprot:CAMPEP_0182554032 /NCGR_PEP_ID=MMETSP1323-20130603/49784_1 /TAXON_ID=236787 /ORGANISM="Florenciella parvula, Strain RCC1693" /LENGTH=288 /DNA_ID=CAMNT_0024765755 /DNA_START=660 /DNA_END=1529 /DNA_ORIENTATION=+
MVHLPCGEARILPSPASLVHADPIYLVQNVSLPTNYLHDIFPEYVPNLTVEMKPIQMHGAILALLASIIGPFGGFLASAIKRAYAVKDFAGVIPGHGGITDRMDCQLQMCLITWVYYSTFVHARHGTPTKLLASAMILSKEDAISLYQTLGEYVKTLKEPSREGEGWQLEGLRAAKGTKDARNTPHNVRRGLCHSTATVLSGAALHIVGLSKAGASFVRLPSTNVGTYREYRGGVGALGPRGGHLLATNVAWYVKEHNGRATMPYLQAQPAAIRHPPPHRALLSSSEK